MSLHTVTVKFRGIGPQSAWLSRLEGFCRQLIAEQFATEAKAQAVFPGHREPRLAGLFTVDLVDATPDIAQRFRALRDVEYAERAAPRRLLSRTGTS